MSELIPKGDREALVNLLTRLAQLDPALCQLSGDNMFTLAGKGICADFFPHFPRVYTDERELVLAWIQYAVQQAIVARGWSLAINPIHWRVGNFYEAVVFTPGKDGWHESENIAEALLSAYVRALEAERVRGEGP